MDDLQAYDLIERAITKVFSEVSEDQNLKYDIEVYQVLRLEKAQQEIANILREYIKQNKRG